MTDKTIVKIVTCMGLSGQAAEIQRIQTAHRLKLIDFWGIPKGARVLEIGCGQGDTLAALSFSVGNTGFVHGVDIASESYGAPETLGQARARLMNSPLGGNIRMDFDFDIMKDNAVFNAPFDYVVLSHCLWYFSSFDELKAILSRVRQFGKRLCLAEWNPSVTMPEQLAHLQAATIQAICESFRHSAVSNIRTMFYPCDLERAMVDSGWTAEKSGLVDSPDLQDGQWEIGTATAFYPDEIVSNSDMPDRLKRLMLAQIDGLKRADVVLPMSIAVMVGI